MMMQRFLSSGLLLGMGVALVGCQPSQDAMTQLSLDVKPSSQAGTYKLSGTSNLPDGTALTVQGLRQLTATDPTVPRETATSFSILDRRAIRVSGGRWEASLNIWQQAPDGNPAETWQVSVPGGHQNFAADDEILFTVTTPPRKDAQALEKAWDATKNNAEGQQVGFTATGLWYLKAGKQLTLEPPSISDEAATNGPTAIAIWQNQGEPEPLTADPSIEDPSLADSLTDAVLNENQMLR